jgi:hypothetical protein
VWAEWIAWQLEEAGHRVKIQAWDFSPGGNFVIEMQKAIVECERTVAVFPPNYFLSEFGAAEWAAAFRLDPTGKNEKLIPVRVEVCQPPGLLGSIVYIDFVKLDETTARDRLNAGLPTTKPRDSALRAVKEVVGIHVLLTRSVSGDDILHRFLWRVSLAKPTSAPLRF